MKVLVCGESGQLAQELKHSQPAGWEVAIVGRAQLDVTEQAQVDDRVSAFKPDVIINASAYTAVDKAEQDKDAAYLVNEIGAANLARAATHCGAHLVHISTDFVFNGQHYKPYLPDDATDPLGVYGASKLAGEQQVKTICAGQSTIIRTAWVYSVFGNNFVKTMLRLMAEKPKLGIVADQIGTPTWAKSLALVCWESAKTKAVGCFHWTDAGVASWYDFAVAIQELALEKQLLGQAIPIEPIAASAYPTPAKRPHFSVLDKSSTLAALPATTMVHWRAQLSAMLDELVQQH